MFFIFFQGHSKIKIGFIIMQQINKLLLNKCKIDSYIVLYTKDNKTEEKQRKKIKFLSMVL